MATIDAKRSARSASAATKRREPIEQRVPSFAEVRRELRRYALNKRRLSPELQGSLDEAEFDDVIDASIAIWQAKYSAAKLTCKHTTMVVAIFNRQLWSYLSKRKRNRGERGRPPAPRYRGRELKKAVKQACEAEFRERTGLAWSTVWKFLSPRLSNGDTAIRTRLVLVVSEHGLRCSAVPDSRLMAVTSLLAGNYPRLSANAARSVGAVIAREIEAIRLAVKRHGGASVGPKPA